MAVITPCMWRHGSETAARRCRLRAFVGRGLIEVHDVNGMAGLLHNTDSKKLARFVRHSALP